GLDVLADRDVDLFDCCVSTTAAHDDFPPIDADVPVQFESERGGVFLIRCSKPEPTALAAMLNLHRIASRRRNVESDPALPIPDIGLVELYRFSTPFSRLGYALIGVRCQLY